MREIRCIDCRELTLNQLVSLRNSIDYEDTIEIYGEGYLNHYKIIGVQTCVRKLNCKYLSLCNGKKIVYRAKVIYTNTVVTNESFDSLSCFSVFFIKNRRTIKVYKKVEGSVIKLFLPLEDFLL